MALSTLRPIILVMFVLGPISAFSQTFPSLAAGTDKQLLRPAELDQLVAPIALYPDTLLSEVLMASTYPLEVVQAERWLNANSGLKGDRLKEAVDKQPWDESIKSLIATPSVLEMMNSKIDWTQKLGNAAIDQQADVMDAIQRLRAKAQANNKLQTTEQQKVVLRRSKGGKLSPSSRPIPTRSMFRTTIPAWFMETGHTPTIHHTTGRRPDTSPQVSSRPASPSVPPMLSDDGCRAVIGAATSIGIETTSR
jgi:Protein of unknown function (DUF3300)